MEELSKKQMIEIVGGISITGTLLSAIARGIETIMELGRSLGESIRRIRERNICPF